MDEAAEVSQEPRTPSTTPQGGKGQSSRPGAPAFPSTLAGSWTGRGATGTLPFGVIVCPSGSLTHCTRAPTLGHPSGWLTLDIQRALSPCSPHGARGCVWARPEPGAALPVLREDLPWAMRAHSVLFLPPHSCGFGVRAHGQTFGVGAGGGW